MRRAGLRGLVVRIVPETCYVTGFIRIICRKFRNFCDTELEHMMTTLNRPDLSDIHIGDWVDRWLPAAWRPYARLARIDRPVGIWLTFFPCLAALIQASQGLPEFRLLVVFFLGAFLMRSAGSTANDIADRNFDGHVERTRLRPLASGQLRTRHALIFLGNCPILAK